MMGIRTTALAAMGLGALIAAQPASATLQIAFTDGTTIVTCADGQLGCDLAGAAKNLLTLNTTVGDFTVFGTLSFSTSGTANHLDLSSFGVINNGPGTGTLTMVLSDTGFTAPVSSVNESASLTFNDAVGSGPSTLKFWADPADTQGAGNPILTPGPLLFSTSGTPVTNPDSFSGTASQPFSALSAFSMTEGASLNLIAGASITGFNESMRTSSIPEPKTWVMGLIGFGLVGLMGLKRAKASRFANI